MAEMIEGPLTDYELARQAILARNRARMIALGIPLASANLSALVVQQRQVARPGLMTSGKLLLYQVWGCVVK
jgi:hypothetical protein